ncbi:unnamed protein product [Aspergillus oryzae]|uniref:Unnamed protein product n=2 Tax=Aspergillus oryzae TaxID=5062 RepID=A0AAN5BNA5_ASPOZ|nr:unnamed protein product [Aspergillus oryzae]GMF87965.1 unnamed protein product [Aspergillus oryzae]GMG06463.1 unnamed protein product [Aspergillus oryzae]GMG24304.1 unnamed protein product [Aspergillus oryzae]GMG47582.1 unnamed protein product [Aspergillus oryzae var. brunneus]
MFARDGLADGLTSVVIFVDNSDPYVEDLEAALGESEAAILAANAQSRDWNAQQTISLDGETQGLKALSAAAIHDQLPYTSLNMDQQPLPTPDSGVAFNAVPATTVTTGPSPNPTCNPIPGQPSPPVSISPSNSTNNNINFLLNPSQSLSPQTDPSLQNATARRSSSLTARSVASRGAGPAESKPDVPAETDREIMFLLRHFSESPGLCRFSNGVHSDEVLAATAILSVYEFLDATGPAWNRHLSGVKSLLDVAEVGMMPLEQHPSPGEALPQPLKRPGLSKARRATFWNFARQDYLAAFINECNTRLNTDDLVLWTEAGLQIDNMGFIIPSNSNAAGYPEGDDVMKEDLIGNGLIWILSKIINFISSGDNLQLGSGPVNTGPLGISQQVLLERWYRLETELDVWYNGLPDTFRPCARLEHPLQKDGDGDGDGCALSEIWYSIPVCSSAMQHYHMARILLLINKPHESTSRRSTITNRLNSYRSIESEIRFHSREIVGISMAHPEGSVRINSLQPLFVSGQCLTEPREREMVLQLLRGIEFDLGWATGYRVKQLLREWGWDEQAKVGAP